MCIRDRSNPKTILFILLIYISYITSFFNWFYCIKKSISLFIIIYFIPVSYTHLDVYKRQPMTSTAACSAGTNRGRKAAGASRATPICKVNVMSENWSGKICEMYLSFPFKSLKIYGEFLTNPYKFHPPCSATVSYTHLDVYKRQR